MTFLPIVERELRVQARQKRTFRLRLANAAVAMALVVFVLFLDEGTPGSTGRDLFRAMAGLGFIYCLLGGAASTADCLSEEKREGTLGFLFLTDLKGYDVVLGKMLATSLHSFYALMAVFPLLGLTLCIGGVTAGEFWRLVLLLTSTLFFSLAVGMFVSALSREEHRASIAAALVLSLFGLPCLIAFGSVFDTRYVLRPAAYWDALLLVHGLSWIVLSVASVVLPRAWQDHGKLPRARPSPGRQTRPSWFRSLVQKHRRRARESFLSENPVAWFVHRGARRICRFTWCWVIGASAIALTVAFVQRGQPSIVLRLCLCALALHLLLVIWAAFQAVRLFNDARKSGSLELLLVAPLKEGQIPDGFYLGIRRAFSGPLKLLLVVEAMVIAMEGWFLIQDNPGRSGEGMSAALVMVGGFCMLVFVTDLFAVARMGMWLGFVLKKPGHAFWRTVIFVMCLPLLLVCSGPLLPWIWLWKNAVLMSYGREKLREHFRAIVSEGLPQKPPAGWLAPFVQR